MPESTIGELKVSPSIWIELEERSKSKGRVSLRRGSLKKAWLQRNIRNKVLLGRYPPVEHGAARGSTGHCAEQASLSTAYL